MPSVQKAYKKYSGKDVVVLVISLDGGEASSVKKFLDSNHYTMPAVHDKGMVYGRKINARAVPTTFIADRQHHLVATSFGPLDYERPDVKKLIQTLVAQPRS
jgi:hypothetical protein